MVYSILLSAADNVFAVPITLDDFQFFLLLPMVPRPPNSTRHVRFAVALVPVAYMNLLGALAVIWHVYFIITLVRRLPAQVPVFQCKAGTPRWYTNTILYCFRI